MTELAIPHANGLAAVPNVTALDTREPTESLIAWAEKARAAHGIAQSLARTPFVPDSLRGNSPEETASNVTAAILTGDEIGLQPMASMRSIDVVKGTPAMRAHTMRALVQSRGHQVWPEDQSETRVVMCGRRRGTEQIVRVTWTMDRAKKLGVASGRNYQTQPGTMLIARATAEICRLIAADVLLGIPYAVEELADGADLIGGPEPTDPKAAKKRTARRAPVQPAAPVAAADPGLDEPEQAEAVISTAPAEPPLDEGWPNVATPPTDGES